MNPPKGAPAAVNPRVVVALVCLYVIWGSTYLAMREAARSLPPLGMAAVRFVTAGSILLVVQRARGAKWPSLVQWGYSAPVGALMFLFGNGMVALAVQHLGSGLAAVVCATMPLFAALFTIVLPARSAGASDRPRAREWIGLCLGLVGVVILASGRELRGNPLMAGVLFLAPIGWALGSVLARRLPLPPGPTSAATQMVTGGLALLVGASLHGEVLPKSYEPVAVLSFFYLIVFGSVVGFTAYTYLLQTVRPALAMSYAYVNPLIAVALGALLAAEEVTMSGLLATAFIASAVALLVGAKGSAKGPARAVGAGPAAKGRAEK